MFVMLVGILLLGVGRGAASAPIPVTACGRLADRASYRLDKDLFVAAGTCLVIARDGVTLDLNGHSIQGRPGATAGITSTANNITVKGPGVVHGFDGPCISLYQAPQPGAMRPVSRGGRDSLVQNVTAYNCGTFGIRLGGSSRCVGCRVHDTGHLFDRSDLGLDTPSVTRPRR
jgi:hypothetical protein